MGLWSERGFGSCYLADGSASWEKCIVMVEMQGLGVKSIKRDFYGSGIAMEFLDSTHN